MIEARCIKCGEIFNPHPPFGADDLEHYEREDGEECGGAGVIIGAWGPNAAAVHATLAELDKYPTPESHFGIALEISAPGWDDEHVDALTTSVVALLERHGVTVHRSETHPDPDAILQPESETT